MADTAGWIEMCGVADLLWLESPSNPLLTMADLDAICAARRKRGAVLVVDSTFATPLNQRPPGARSRRSLQSVTKFICGHLCGGVVTVRHANLLSAPRQARELAGATRDTIEAFSRRSAGPGPRAAARAGTEHRGQAGIYLSGDLRGVSLLMPGKYAACLTIDGQTSTRRSPQNLILFLPKEAD